MYGKCIRAIYLWSITRGGLWWEGSLNGGTTVFGKIDGAVSLSRNAHCKAIKGAI